MAAMEFSIDSEKQSKIEQRRASIAAKTNELDDYILRHHNVNNTEQVESVSKEFFDQDEFVIIRQFFPKDFVRHMLIPDVDRVHPYVNRSYIPIQKKGGSVSSFVVAKKANVVNHLYHSKPFIEYLQRITKEEKFFECPSRDPHAVALYYYEEPGDHISWHYDSSFYNGKRFTVLVGMVDDHDRESCKLLCHLYTKSQGKQVVVQSVSLEPGDLVMFNGDKLWHSVTPMTDVPNQKRVVLSMEYVSDDGMGMIARTVSNIKDAVTYFGVSSLIGFNNPVEDEDEGEDDKKKPQRSGWNIFPTCW